MKTNDDANTDIDVNMDLDLDWLNEEKQLIDMTETPLPTFVPKLSIQFFFIDNSSTIFFKTSCVQSLDVHETVSILPNDRFCQQIENAKQQYRNTLSRDDNIKEFEVSNIIVWQTNIHADQIPLFVNSSSKEWDGMEFIEVSVRDDIVIQPSLFIFHSLQTAYVFLKEKNIPRNVPTLARVLKSSISTGKNKNTKKVHFVDGVHSKKTRKFYPST
jgi:hypothetical protein